MYLWLAFLPEGNTEFYWWPLGDASQWSLRTSGELHQMGLTLALNDFFVVILCSPGGNRMAELSPYTTSRKRNTKPANHRRCHASWATSPSPLNCVQAENQQRSELGAWSLSLHNSTHQCLVVMAGFSTCFYEERVSVLHDPRPWIPLGYNSCRESNCCSVHIKLLSLKRITDN